MASRAKFYHLSPMQMSQLRKQFPGGMALTVEPELRKTARKLGLKPEELVMALRRDWITKMRRQTFGPMPRRPR